jgi:hypothetical protein
MEQSLVLILDLFDNVRYDIKKGCGGEKRRKTPSR